MGVRIVACVFGAYIFVCMYGCLPNATEEWLEQLDRKTPGYEVPDWYRTLSYSLM